VTKENSGEPGTGSAFAAGCLRTDREGAIGGDGAKNGEPGVDVVGAVLVVLVVDTVLNVGKELVVSREMGVVG
jgi:hypothetical protein